MVSLVALAAEAAEMTPILLLSALAAQGLRVEMERPVQAQIIGVVVGVALVETELPAHRPIKFAVALGIPVLLLGLLFFMAAAVEVGKHMLPEVVERQTEGMGVAMAVTVSL